MIALLALLLQAGQPGSAALPPPPEIDAWDALPALALDPTSGSMADLSSYVQEEVEAGRCHAASVDAAGTSTLRAGVSVLVDSEGRVRSIVPIKIGCPTVEQYTAGVVGRLAAGNVRPPWPTRPQWYRTGLVYRWTKAPVSAR